jgi:hypothetical protein
MNTYLIFQILDLAVTLAKAQFQGNAQQHFQVEQALLEIVQAGAQAYQLHTGQPIDPSVIKAEVEI